MRTVELRIGKYGSLTGRPYFQINMRDETPSDEVINNLSEYNIPQAGEGSRLVFNNTAYEHAVRKVREAFPRAHAIYMRDEAKVNSEVWDLCDWVIDNSSVSLIDAMAAHEIWITGHSQHIINRLLAVPKKLIANKVIVVRPTNYGPGNERLDYLTMYALIPHTIMFQE